jgi:hypothetical protein
MDDILLHERKLLLRSIEVIFHCIFLLEFSYSHVFLILYFFSKFSGFGENLGNKDCFIQYSLVEYSVGLNSDILIDRSITSIN